MPKTIPLIACTCLIAMLPGTLGAQSLTPQQALDPTVLAPLFEVSDLTVQSLHFVSVGGPSSAEIVVEIDVEGETWTLALEPYSLRSDLFRVLVDDGSGTLLPYPEPPVLTRKGSVLEIPGSRVRGSFDGQHLHAMIFTDQGTWVVQPVDDVGLGGAESAHVVFAAEDSIPGPYTCGNIDPHNPGSGTGGPIPFGPTLFLTEIGIDADFEFFTLNSSNVGVTVNDVELVMNAVEGVYDNSPILIVYELTTIVVRTTSADPYGTQSAPGSLLNLFASVWSTPPENAIHRDVAHLFTGVNLDGSIIGIAQLADICTTNSYGLSQSRYTTNFNSRVALTAHELGHNWGAAHCDGSAECRIMCSGLGGCNGLSPLTFASGPTNQIVSYRNSRPCLGVRPAAVPLPFEEQFTTSVLDTTRWLHNNGGAISSAGLSEPSAPFSFVLDATGAGIYEDDELRSNRILLGGTSDPNLSLFVHQQGVDAGEQLVIEYLNSSLDWLLLDAIGSTEVTSSDFTQFTYDLPPNARHNNFRVRFRAEVDSAVDDWFIDNITVSEGPPPTLDPPTILGVIPSNGPSAGGTLISVIGTDFNPDIVILVGGQLLVGLVYVDSTEVQGLTPGSPTPGGTSVIANQGSGSDVLDPGFTYNQEDLIHGNGSGAPGGTATVSILADHETVLAAYSVAVDFDATEVEIAEVTDLGSDAAGAQFFTQLYDNSTTGSGGWWTLGVVLDFNGIITLPPQSGTVLALATYDIPAGASLGSVIDLTPVTGVGAPPTENLFVNPAGAAVTPTLFAGMITVSGVNFIRGDANRDSLVNIGDAVATLDWLFNSGPGLCMDSLDANDDGSINIADAVKLLDYLFVMGSEPPAPFPNAGTDPTADPLDCAE